MVIVSGFEFSLRMPDTAFFFSGIFSFHDRLINNPLRHLPDRGQESFCRQLHSLVLLISGWICLARTGLLWAVITLCMFGMQ